MSANKPKKCLQALYAAACGPWWLGPIGSTYALMWFLAVHFLSIQRSSAALLSTKYAVLIGCLVTIEAINQIAFYLKKRKTPQAIVFKAIAFWVIFTAGMITYTCMLLMQPVESEWVWHEDIEAGFVYLLGAWVLGYYATNPTVRFLFLGGSYRKQHP